MLKKITGLLLVMITGHMQAQAQTNIYDLPKLIPPTPAAAALEKFGSIPVNYATGIPNISYPFWSWKRGRLSFDMGLSYHAGGHKVDDMAANTGLGWALSGPGRVSRTVRGLADDAFMGYLYTPVLPDANTYNYDPTQYYYTGLDTTTQHNVVTNIAITPYNTPYSDSIRQIAQGQLDGEQDVFSFSCGGQSGRFVFNKNKQIVPLEHTNCLITPIYYAATQGSPIIAFTVTDDKGLVYKFEYEEQQVSTNENDAGTTLSYSVQSVVSGWLLTKVIDPMTQDSIVYHYADNTNGAFPALYETGFSESQSYSLEHADYTQGLVIPGTQLSSDVNSLSVISSNDSQLSEVDLPDGSVVNITYGLSRLDFVNSKALTKIRVHNYQGRLVKWYQLNYSYFDAAAGFHPLMGTSTNDYTKRLRLDGVNELSNDSGIVKPTLFTYNSLQLNPRGSMNQDFWGYNVNPLRNNLYYVPTIRLFDEDVVGYVRYLPGADRTPDSDYVKAAVLEKIQYPTGGSTHFDYECNKAFSANDYYGNTIALSALTWQKTGFGQSISLPAMDDRTSITVSLLFQTQEFDPRPTPDPGAPQTCFDTQQDMQTTTFVIESTDHTFSDTIQDVYGNFHGTGTARDIDLPLGKTYTLTFLYDASTTCSFTYPFQAVVTGTYFVAPYDKLAGGLRVTKITSDDGYGNTLVKTYSYNDSTGHSSCALNDIPNFGYYKTGFNATQDVRYILHVRQVNRTSNPSGTLNYFSGSPILYQVVKEREVDGAITERHFDPLVSSYTNSSNVPYPYLPGQDFQNLSGLSNTQLVKDNANTIKTVTYTHYSQIQGHYTDALNRNIKTGTIATAIASTGVYYAAQPYFSWLTHADEVLDTSISYESSGQLVSVQSKTYDAVTRYPVSVSTTNSKGQAKRTDYLYATDLANSAIPPYTVMVAGNMLSPMVKQSDYLDNNFLQSVQTNYKSWGGGLYAPDTIATNVLGAGADTRLQYYAYDGKGNVLTVAKQDDAYNTYLWGYNNQYPVAKIAGADYSTASSHVTQSVLNNPAGDAQLRSHLNGLRSGLPNALVSTYTYIPLVGVSSETDPSGRTTYYEYDGLNRLKLVRDRDSNIVKRYCYNYAGQAVDCDGNTNTGLSGGSTGSGTIYAKLTLENMQGNVSTTYYDVVVRFYSDAACTIPINVTGLTVNFTTTSQTAHFGTLTLNGSTSCTGNSTVFVSSFLISQSGTIVGTAVLDTGTGYTIEL